MLVLQQLACAQGRRDEVPNQELARDLAEQDHADAVRELAANLWNHDRNVRSDCLKVLYEIGYLKPGLIADYYMDFLKLLGDKNNRMVWGGMIALATIAPLRADALFRERAVIQEAMAGGSVIVVDNAVKALAAVAAANDAYRQDLLPHLFHHLETCRNTRKPSPARWTWPMSLASSQSCKAGWPVGRQPRRQGCKS